ncbi:alternate F1F0 ATPase, F1 subunit alpha [Thermodesulfobacteriota bacterium]
MENELKNLLNDVDHAIETGVEKFSPTPEAEEVGRVKSVGQGIVSAEGLGGVKSEELVSFGPEIQGMVLDILPDRVGIILFGPSEDVRAGDEVTRSGRVLDLPVGPSLVGRVVDPLGRPLDGKGAVREEERWPALREAPQILDRSPVEKPLQTGLKVVDALIPIGRGQRELILGDRQTGKTAIAVDTIINQKGKDVTCIYCAIGQRSSSIAKVVDELKEHDAMSYSLVVVVEGDDPPGLQYIAPYAATTIGEYFMHEGRDVLIVYDDLTRHALAYRQLSLLLRRPPGREAFPGDIFYIHSKLLERATHLKPELGGGSLTALPIAETEAQNISAYIPTNLISITDGQIYVSPDLFQRGLLPAVDVGKSVSRVGGRAQIAAYRQVAGDLRLSYTQFQELESFARFGTRLDERTRKTLEHGKRVREALKQNQASALSAGEQVVVLLAVTRGIFDDIPLEKMAMAQQTLLEKVNGRMPELDNDVEKAGPDDPLWEKLVSLMADVLETLKENHADIRSVEQEDQDRPGPVRGGQDNEKPGSGKHKTV